MLWNEVGVWDNNNNNVTLMQIGSNSCSTNIRPRRWNFEERPLNGSTHCVFVFHYKGEWTQNIHNK